MRTVCFPVVQATLPVAEGGLAGRVYYFDTEKSFSVERLVEIAKQRFASFLEGKPSSVLRGLIDHVRVFTVNALELESIFAKLEELEETLVTEQVRLFPRYSTSTAA